jgi:hypothetical protein
LVCDACVKKDEGEDGMMWGGGGMANGREGENVQGAIEWKWK